MLHRSQRYSRLPGCGSAGADRLDQPQNHSSRRGRAFWISVLLWPITAAPTASASSGRRVSTRFTSPLATTVLAFVWGTFLAWTVERTNTPLARLIGLVTLGRIIIPGVIITISWILMASPSIGILNHLIASLTGVSRFLNIYSFWGMVWVQALEMTPLAYLLMSAALQSIDPRLEEASAIAGARHLADFSPDHFAAGLAGRGRGGFTVVYPNRGELRGAAIARRPRARVGLHDGSLLQHLAHADRLGIVEHLFDGVAALGDGVALRLFQTGAPRRALPNHHRQGLPAATRRSWPLEISGLRAQLAADFSHHRVAVSHDALRVVPAALSSADRRSLPGDDMA